MTVPPALNINTIALVATNTQPIQPNPRHKATTTPHDP